MSRVKVLFDRLCCQAVAEFLAKAFSLSVFHYLLIFHFRILSNYTSVRQITVLHSNIYCLIALKDRFYIPHFLWACAQYERTGETPKSGWLGHLQLIRIQERSKETSQPLIIFEE